MTQSVLSKISCLSVVTGAAWQSEVFRQVLLWSFWRCDDSSVRCDSFFRCDVTDKKKWLAVRKDWLFASRPDWAQKNY